MKKQIENMDKSINCLAIEIPEAVHNHVSKTWNELKVELKKTNLKKLDINV